MRKKTSMQHFACWTGCSQLKMHNRMILFLENLVFRKAIVLVLVQSSKPPSLECCICAVPVSCQCEINQHRSRIKQRRWPCFLEKIYFEPFPALSFPIHLYTEMQFADEREHTLREVAALGNIKATLHLAHAGVNLNSQNAMNGW